MEGRAKVWHEIAAFLEVLPRLTPPPSTPTRRASSPRHGMWDVIFATTSTEKLVADVCLRLLRGLTTLRRDEMRLAGYADDVPQIDVCAGVE